MTWHCYQLCFLAESDICIGFHKLGWVQRTRYFIPARNLWAAATDLYARSLATTDARPNWAADEVSSWLRFSAFFPADTGGNPQFWWGDGNAGAARDFEHAHVDSRGRAAIDPGSATALEGALFDMEYLAAFPAADQARLAQARFVGYAWTTSSQSDIEVLLKSISVGGERRYGMGRLRLERIQCAPSSDLFGIAGLNWSIAPGDVPQLHALKNTPLPAQILAQDCPDNVTISGELEPVVGRSTIDNGAGQKLESMQLCWAPGATLDRDQNFTITAQGLWKMPPIRVEG